MRVATALTRPLGLAYPIVRASMAGDPPELVSAVSNAGAIGFFGAGYLRGGFQSAFGSLQFAFNFGEPGPP
jgi:NAD(P)H-dependent flavin oxidoreductase YrpB (nitropropane dioxygenase family)